MSRISVSTRGDSMFWITLTGVDPQDPEKALDLQDFSALECFGQAMGADPITIVAQATDAENVECVLTAAEVSNLGIPDGIPQQALPVLYCTLYGIREGAAIELWAFEIQFGNSAGYPTVEEP